MHLISLLKKLIGVKCSRNIFRLLIGLENVRYEEKENIKNQLNCSSQTPLRLGASLLLSGTLGHTCFALCFLADFTI